MLPADTLTRKAGGYTGEEEIQAGQMLACANYPGMIGWAWVVDFGKGSVFSMGAKVNVSLFAWCVRGLQGVDPQ